MEDDGLGRSLYEALLQKGFPEDYCALMVKRYLRTDYTRTRMLGYLYRYEDPSIEDVTDEMLAILSDRNAIMQKKQMEEAQAQINEIYRYGLGVDTEEDEE